MHQKSDVIRIQLFRRKIKLQRIGSPHFGVKDIALLDQFLCRFRTYPRARESQRHYRRESVEQEGGLHHLTKSGNSCIHRKLETVGPVDFMVSPGSADSFL